MSPRLRGRACASCRRRPSWNSYSRTGGLPWAAQDARGQAARLQTERTLEREALPVRLRLFSELLRLSRPRANAPGERVVSPPPPHHELAARIGARREVVSRELSEMTREGWLARDRRAIRILRVAEMQKLVMAELRAPAA